MPTFTPPPLDGTLTIAQIYDWHFRNNPSHRLFLNHLTNDPDTIPYFVLFVSCLRANCVPFPISPRKSPSAVAHLISKAGVNHLLIGHEPAMFHLAEEAVKILKGRYPMTSVPDVSYVPLFEELFVPGSGTVVAPEALRDELRDQGRRRSLCCCAFATQRYDRDSGMCFAPCCSMQELKKVDQDAKFAATRAKVIALNVKTSALKAMTAGLGAKTATLKTARATLEGTILEAEKADQKASLTAESLDQNTILSERASA
ncbi:Acetyl-CoA synthetase-like protein [Mycena venus]|uniref:Acetyl-CoA synthetase-like protein n=1 Tax=Mycena venus TaxID=2733690 RepID=A0A8H6WYA3_9AGAR|nr:Acetyl-CoA synthetase-like protein [Mycena venus]